MTTEIVPACPGPIRRVPKCPRCKRHLNTSLEIEKKGDLSVQSSVGFTAVSFPIIYFLGRSLLMTYMIVKDMCT